MDKKDSTGKQAPGTGTLPRQTTSPTDGLKLVEELTCEIMECAASSRPAARPAATSLPGPAEAPAGRGAGAATSASRPAPEGSTAGVSSEPAGIADEGSAPGAIPGGACSQAPAGSWAEPSPVLGLTLSGEALARANELLEEPVVEPWPEPVDLQALLESIVEKLHAIVVLPKWAAETSALWTVHTYAYQLREVATYLGLESPMHRCGKSTFLDVMGLITNRALRAANVSSPAFFRTIAELQPTLLIDEADTFLDSEELRGILNSGYRRKGAFVLRVANEGPHKGSGANVAKFSCWCPKAIARIGRLPDTLRDRCIVFLMQRKLESEESGRLLELEPIPIRRKCMRFVLDHAQEIASARPKLPRGLNDRAADIWEPLLVIADLAGGKWPEVARQAAVALSTQADATNPSTALLLDLFSICIQAGGKRIFSRTLVAGLNAMTERPWAELRPGKKVTETWLARQLRNYGIEPKTIWLEGQAAKGYLQEELDPVCRRYLPKEQVAGMLLGLKSAQKESDPANPGE